MGTKTISIMDDAYGLLTALKRSDESFSDEIRRLATAQGSIMEFASAWKDIPEVKIEHMKERILERRSNRSRLEELHRRR